MYALHLSMAVLIPSRYKLWGKCLIGLGFLLFIGFSAASVLNDSIFDLEERKVIWSFMHAPFIAGLLLLILAREKNEDERSIRSREKIMSSVLYSVSLFTLLHICVFGPLYRRLFSKPSGGGLFDSGPTLVMFILLYIHVCLQEARYKERRELNEELPEASTGKE